MRIAARTVAMLTLCFWLTAAQADDFRIETKVYSGKGEKPTSQSTTLFRAGLVYDFLSGEDEVITVYEPEKNRFVLLAPDRKTQVEISLEEITDFVDNLRDQAAARRETMMKFLAEPEFSVELDETSGTLLMQSIWLNYRLSTVVAPNDDVARQYGDFSDQFARLNSLLNPGSLPPFSRLVVNEQLRDHKLIPTDVQLTLLPKETKRKQVSLRAEHQVEWKLRPGDYKRMDRAGRFLDEFRIVTLDDYRQTEETPDAPDSSARNPSSTRRD